MLNATLKKYHRPINTHTLDFSHRVFPPSSATAAPPFLSTRAEVGRAVVAAFAAVPPRVWRRKSREHEGREAGVEARLLLRACRNEEEGGRAKKESAVTTRRRVEITRR